MDLISRPSNSIEFGGKQYTINFSFNNILLIIRLVKDPRIADSGKIETIIKLLEPRPKPPEHGEFVTHVLNEYIFEGAKKSDGATPSFDFFHDAAAIYASFYQDYKIDLHEHTGTMHWETFKALFIGLSDKTTIKQIINIRTCKIPTLTKYNREEVQRLRMLKLQHSLALKENPDIQRQRFEEKMIRWIEGIKKR